LKRNLEEEETEWKVGKKAIPTCRVKQAFTKVSRDKKEAVKGRGAANKEKHHRQKNIPKKGGHPTVRHRKAMRSESEGGGVRKQNEVDGRY